MLFNFNNIYIEKLNLTLKLLKYSKKQKTTLLKTKIMISVQRI